MRESVSKNPINFYEASHDVRIRQKAFTLFASLWCCCLHCVTVFCCRIIKNIKKSARGHTHRRKSARAAREDQMAPTTPLILRATHTAKPLHSSNATSGTNYTRRGGCKICANCTFGRSCSHKNASYIKAMAKSQMRDDERVSWLPSQRGLKAMVFVSCKIHTLAHHKRTSVWWKLLICGREFFFFNDAPHTEAWDRQGTRARTKRLSFSRRSESKFYAITSTNFKGEDLSLAH